jgi:hypothetical protein
VTGCLHGTDEAARISAGSDRNRTRPFDARKLFLGAECRHRPGSTRPTREELGSAIWTIAVMKRFRELLDTNACYARRPVFRRDRLNP